MDILRYQRLRYRELTSYDKMMRHKNTGTINKILYVQRGHTPACVSICAAKITDVLSCFIAFLHIMQSPYAQTNYRSLPLLPPPPSSPPPPHIHTHKHIPTNNLKMETLSGRVINSGQKDVLFMLCECLQRMEDSSVYGPIDSQIRPPMKWKKN